MENITLKTKWLTYEITGDGKNAVFRSADGEDRLIKGACAVIVDTDKNEIPSTRVALNGDAITLTFADGTEATVLVRERERYITFTLTGVSREDFLSISFLNVHLGERKNDYEAVMLGMTAATKMEEHPGDNRSLIASAFPYIGLTSTKRSKYPAKAAFFIAPKELVREIEREILEEIPDGELPKSRIGGPYADRIANEARGDYFILMQDTATPEKVNTIIKEMRRFGLTQITLHHNSHYRQGDFLPRECEFPNGIKDLKAVVDRFHENGISVGLQTYSFFLSKQSKYVSPIPHKDLDVLKTFTLKEAISENATALSVAEDEVDVTANEGFIFVNSPYLWIDDELVKFSLCENGRFTVVERGALGTTPSPHSAGCEVKQLKQYFLLPLAKAGSELFYEIAKNTAELINDTGADYFYLDALDGAFVLDGEDYVWYHAVDFVNEMFAHLKHDVIFDCCYNPQYTGTWFARSRYGAIDVSLNAHRACVDAHVEYNERTAKRMGITSELGWLDLFVREDDPKRWWLNEHVYPEDLEYALSKAFATSSSVALLESFRRHGALPKAEPLAKLMRDYAELRQTVKPTENTVAYLTAEKNGAHLLCGKLYKSRAYTVTFEQGDTVATVKNEFKEQVPSFRLEALSAADRYDREDAITLAELDEANPITSPIHLRFNTPVRANGNHGLGVWCCGDGSGALVTVSLRNLALNSRKASEHYIKADFVGWKYFAFYETQNAMLESEALPPRRLEYKTYNHLQEFYGFYRAKMDYETLDGVDITVSGSDNIRLRSIRLVPEINPEIINPTLRFGKTSIKILTRIPSGASLYFDGQHCTVMDEGGCELSQPSFIGEPIIESGSSTLSLEREEETPLSRARLTVFTLGDLLQ